MDCLKTLYIASYISNIGAPTPTSSNFCFLNFRFFMPPTHMPTMVGCLSYEIEHISCPEKNHVHSLICNKGAWIFSRHYEWPFNVDAQFSWTGGVSRRTGSSDVALLYICTLVGTQNQVSMHLYIRYCCSGPPEACTAACMVAVYILLQCCETYSCMFLSHIHLQ